jgi:hypothetical protein
LDVVDRTVDSENRTSVAGYCSVYVKDRLAQLP